MKEQEVLRTIETENFISERMVVKIGSSSITKNGDPLNLELMDSIARQSSRLFGSGVEIAIISSGSVACGKKLLAEFHMDVIHNQVAAIYGQSLLMEAWNGVFKKYGVHVGQVIFSEDDLQKPNIPIIAALSYGIQIINANDAVNDTEMKAFFLSADNDKLAVHVAKFIGADTLLLLTDTNGVLDIEGNTIHELHPNQVIQLAGKSETGTGGMLSKVRSGFETAAQNIRTVIANANETDVIEKIAQGESIGTKLIA